MSRRNNQPGDQSLGLNDRICRRDFLNASLLGSGSLLLKSWASVQNVAQEESDWDGPGGVGDYRNANGNTQDVIAAAHKIRDGVFDRLPSETIDTDETHDLVVVGGGISGLSAALFFRDRADAGRTCLVLEN